MAYIGVDLIEIDRIEKALQRWGQKFLNRVYTAPEQDICRRKANALAVRFAGKEAVMKMLGTGRKGAGWKDIEILAHDSGKPVVQLNGRALKKARELGITTIEISLSHSRENAVATVIG
ncbi:MAG: holo-ACP synthase [Dehalococcoidia bacterium]|nr:holo-ACP synthase [Dehalococcoidia bacterium]